MNSSVLICLRRARMRPSSITNFTAAHRLRRPASSRAGFTLLEIMLVVMIIAILAGSAIYLMGNNLEITRVTRARADIENIKTQLRAYEVMNGGLPTTEQGLMALVQRPTGEHAPRKWMQMLPEVPIDPWGTEPYHYRYPAQKSTKDEYDVFACGKDKLPDTADDVGNW